MHRGESMATETEGMWAEESGPSDTMRDRNRAEEYLSSLSAAIAGAAHLIRPTEGGRTRDLETDRETTHRLDVLAFSVAVDSFLLFKEDLLTTPVSPETERQVGLVLAESVSLLRSLESAMDGTAKGERREGSPLHDGLKNMGKTVGTLRNNLRLLCGAWIISEISFLAINSRGFRRKASV
jgi:hypothetical protein